MFYSLRDKHIPIVQCLSPMAGSSSDFTASYLSILHIMRPRNLPSNFIEAFFRPISRSERLQRQRNLFMSLRGVPPCLQLRLRPSPNSCQRRSCQPGWELRSVHAGEDLHVSRGNPKSPHGNHLHHSDLVLHMKETQISASSLSGSLL